MFSLSFVPKIVIINILVFLLWNTYGLIYPEFMINNFLVSWSSLSQGRYWTLLTSVFSHNMTWHIFINMFVFFNFGIIVENYLGPVRFIGFYLLAGITGSLVHCLVCAFILNQPNLMALGASGAISGVIMLFALLYPQERIFLFGIIPLPAIWAAVLFTGVDALGLLNQTRGIASTIGYGAHLGGALTGLIYFAILRIRIIYFSP
ncbi:MAG: rhomboid family intramembrane serine protease [Bacteriovorax sp.]|nr:rhomboid family intramembrane serine protease [Bacteriovorax sp.]